MKTLKNKWKWKSSLNNEFAMHAATRAGSVLFAPPPCAKGTATVKFFTMDYIVYHYSLFSFVEIIFAKFISNLNEFFFAYLVVLYKGKNGYHTRHIKYSVFEKLIFSKYKQRIILNVSFHYEYLAKILQKIKVFE